MKKALASVVVIVFAGLLCTSLLTIFTGYSADSHLAHNGKQMYYPYLSY